MLKGTIRDYSLKGNTKYCPKCDDYKTFDLFYKRKNRAVGLSSWCKTCTRPYGREHAKNNYNVHRARILKQQYGLTHEDVVQMKVLQNNMCDICGVSFDEQTPHVDHNHTSGTTRGLLCGSCNRGIGLLKDNLEVLEKAAKYLLKWQH